MKDYSVLTYATHPEGRFRELLLAVPGIKVGGWGEEWKGFMQKFKFVLDYAEKCAPDHIIIFVDGFDTEVRQSPEEAVLRFKAYNAPLLFSSVGIEMQFPPLLARRVFMCTEKMCLNTGLYMGYAAAVAQALRTALAEEMSACDDQRAMELARQRLPKDLIQVDTERLIFHSMNTDEQKTHKSNAVFLGHNGQTARVAHWLRVLAKDLLMIGICITLGVLLARLGARPCGGYLFPIAVLAFCFMYPTPSMEQISVLFLLTVTALASAVASPA